MKSITAKALLGTIRNLKGILTIWEGYVQAEGRIGVVSVGPAGDGAAQPAPEPAPERRSTS